MKSLHNVMHFSCNDTRYRNGGVQRAVSRKVLFPRHGRQRRRLTCFLYVVSHVITSVFSFPSLSVGERLHPTTSTPLIAAYLVIFFWPCSLQTLGRSRSRSAAAEMSDGWAVLATSAGSARVRWLTYWVAYGAWWHVSLQLGGLLRILPFSTHAQLALLLWLQVPVFRGGGRILDFGERCMERWAQGGAVDASAGAPDTQMQSSQSQPQ